MQMVVLANELVICFPYDGNAFCTQAKGTSAFKSHIDIASWTKIYSESIPFNKNK